MLWAEPVQIDEMHTANINVAADYLNNICMAAPIIKEEQVVGALGISVYLDALHNRINSDLGLSDNYTWFVVNGDGLIMLDMDKDFIFMNALTAVSSLGDQFSKALKNESGDIRYSIDKLERVEFYKKLPKMSDFFYDNNFKLKRLL